jgi:hypothetical protein
LFVAAIFQHHRFHAPADPNARRAGAGIHDSLLGEFFVRDSHRGQDAGQRDRRRCLNVVSETRQSLAVAVEYLECDAPVEVFPLRQRSGKDFFHTFDERLDEIVVRLAAQPPRVPADVVRIAEQLRVVCSDIEADRQAEKLILHAQTEEQVLFPQRS